MTHITIRKFIVCLIIFFCYLLLNILVHQSVFEIALLQKKFENPTIEQIDTTYSNVPEKEAARWWNAQKPIQNGQVRESVPTRKKDLHVQNLPKKTLSTHSLTFFSEKNSQTKDIQVASSSKFSRSEGSREKEVELDSYADVPFPFNLCWHSIQKGTLFPSRESGQIAEISSVRCVEPLPVLEMKDKDVQRMEEGIDGDAWIASQLASPSASPSLILVQREKKRKIPQEIPPSPPENSDFAEKIAQTVAPELLPSENLMTSIQKIEMFEEMPLLEKAPVAMHVGENIGKKVALTETKASLPRLALHVSGPGMDTKKEGEIVPLQEETTSQAPPGFSEITPLQGETSQDISTPLPKEVDFSNPNLTFSAKPILEDDNVLTILSIEDLKSPETSSTPTEGSAPSEIAANRWQYANISPHFGLPQPVQIGSESTSPGLVLLPDETDLVRKEPVNFPPIE